MDEFIESEIRFAKDWIPADSFNFFRFLLFFFALVLRCQKISNWSQTSTGKNFWVRIRPQERTVLFSVIHRKNSSALLEMTTKKCEKPRIRRLPAKIECWNSFCVWNFIKNLTEVSFWGKQLISYHYIIKLYLNLRYYCIMVSFNLKLLLICQLCTI